MQESRQQEVHEARIEAHETIERLKIQLEETEGLLTRKITEVQAAVEAKITAQENASEWESKWLMLCKKVNELERNKGKEEKLSFLKRNSVDGVDSLRNSRTEKHGWFRFKSRPDNHLSFKDTEESVCVMP